MRTLPIITLSLLLLFSSIGSSASTNKIKHLNTALHDTNMPFSEAVQVGDLLYLSGQIGFDPNTGKLAPGGMKAEAKQTMENIKGTLNRLGYTMNDIFKCTVMIADISLWGDFNKVYITYFNNPYPARSAFGANGLAEGGALEVECIAFVGSKD